MRCWDSNQQLQNGQKDMKQSQNMHKADQI